MKKSQGEGGKKGNPYNKNKSRELSQKRELIREKNMMEEGETGRNELQVPTSHFQIISLKFLSPPPTMLSEPPRNLNNTFSSLFF